MGHGLAAAALMAQMRTGLRAYALDGHSPRASSSGSTGCALLARARPDDHARLRRARPRARALSASAPATCRPWSRAGRRAGFLPVDRLAARRRAGTRYREHTFPLPAGATVVLVTDGAVEVRGESLDEGLERLRRLAAAASPTSRRCATR